MNDYTKEDLRKSLQDLELYYKNYANKPEYNSCRRAMTFTFLKKLTEAVINN